MSAQMSRSVHTTSGLYFHTRRRSSHSTGWAAARVGACSRRMPVIQPSAPPSARSSAATFTSLQQRCALHVPSVGNASSTSTWTPKRCSKARHVARVSGNSTPVSIVTIRTSRPPGTRIRASTRTLSSFWKEHSSTRRSPCRATACSSTSSAVMGRAGAYPGEAVAPTLCNELLRCRRQLLRPPFCRRARRERPERLARPVVGLVEREDLQQRLVELPVRDLLEHHVAEARVGAQPAADADVHGLDELAVDLLQDALDPDVADLVLRAAGGAAREVQPEVLTVGMRLVDADVRVEEGGDLGGPAAAGPLRVDLGQAAELLARAGLQPAVEHRRPRRELGGQRLGEQLVDALVRDPREQDVLLVGEPDLGRRGVLARQADELEELRGL